MPKKKGYSLREVKQALEKQVQQGKLKKVYRNSEVCYAEPNYLPETDYLKHTN